MRSADWTRATELLEHSTPPSELKNLTTLKASLLDYTRGMAALAAKDTTAAAAFSKSLDDRVAAKPKEDPMLAMPGMPTSKDAVATPIYSFLDVAALELKASVLLAQGKTADSDTAFVKAAEAERSLGYHEPPNYIRPVGETRGAALMHAGRYADARLAYQAALAERPNSGYPLFGIAQADAASNQVTTAASDYRLLLAAWKNADNNLSQLETARAWLAAHGGMGAE
jgi:hypothetical protein